MDQVALAKALRGWQAENPAADLALGFVPGVGQLYGAATAAAAYADPDASGLERGLATAGMVPFGKGADLLRKIAVGKKGIDRLGQSPDLIPGQWKGGDKKVRQELDDSKASLKPTEWNSYRLEEKLDFPELYRAYPELRSVWVRPKEGRGGTFYAPDEAYPAGLIELGTGLSPEELLRVLKHEVQHGVQHLEGYGPGYSGTYFKGNPRYPRDAGEQEARVTQFRNQWPREMREEIPFVDHQRAEKWRLNVAKERGNPELAAKDMRMMEDPGVIGMILEKLRSTP